MIMTTAAIKMPWQEKIWRGWTNNAHEGWLLTTTLRLCFVHAVLTLASFCQLVLMALFLHAGEHLAICARPPCNALPACRVVNAHLTRRIAPTCLKWPCAANALRDEPPAPHRAPDDRFCRGDPRRGTHSICGRSCCQEADPIFTTTPRSSLSSLASSRTKLSFTLISQATSHQLEEN